MLVAAGGVAVVVDVGATAGGVAVVDVGAVVGATVGGAAVVDVGATVGGVAVVDAAAAAVEVTKSSILGGDVACSASMLSVVLVMVLLGSAVRICCIITKSVSISRRKERADVLGRVSAVGVGMSSSDALSSAPVALGLTDGVCMDVDEKA